MNGGGRSDGGGDPVLKRKPSNEDFEEGPEISAHLRVVPLPDAASLLILGVIACTPSIFPFPSICHTVACLLQATYVTEDLKSSRMELVDVV